MNTTIEEPIARLRSCLPAVARELPADAPLARVALDSLDEVEFLCAVHEEFGVRLSEAEFHADQTLTGLLAAITIREVLV